MHCADSAADAVRQAELVVSAVTAASSGKAAESVKAHLRGDPFFLDINSVSPGRKQDTAKMLGGTARYVDVAVLAPIHPARHQTPMLIAGPDSQAVAPTLAVLGMRASIAGAEIGAAAAIKMVRSVMIKGIEALTLECFLAAARAGVIDEVAASMRNNYPGVDWAKIVPYNLERMAVHGERRAAEMEEVAETLRELGGRAADDKRLGQAPARNGRNRPAARRPQRSRQGPRRRARGHQRRGARSSLGVIRNQFAQKPRAIIDSV